MWKQRTSGNVSAHNLSEFRTQPRGDLLLVGGALLLLATQTHEDV